ncbi:hypothetical protein [Cellvibrio sp. QJXJ]|uniref:hypothetical protein n=1 Tax=Cellvibrio sp. QJXJ TaxID=2964606 RepID=UPI0021C4AAD5|nr:hypothetical protein [Cellvibrio sp. QJXJ]UUA75177.1 hypothetical protein NNX04_22225 [Cellvibrio sp. QJXJ]
MKMRMKPVGSPVLNSKEVKVQATKTEVKKSTVKFTESQVFLLDVGIKERSRILDLAVRRLLSWDSYLNAPWDDAARGLCSIGCGNTWLDVVEMGIEYKTKANLTKPQAISIPVETFSMLELAEARVSQIRPSLATKGIIAGIIRSAIAQDQLTKMIGEEIEIEDSISIAE